MKKLVIVFLAVFMMGSFGVKNALAIEGTADAKCENVDGSGYKEVGFEAPDEQTFIPSYDRLTKIDIIVGGHTWGVDGINFTLYNAIGTSVGTGSIAPTINGGPVTRSWTPQNPITVRKGVTYKFRVENPNTADFVWYTGNNDCYTGGNARQKNINQNFDFGFTTYGYDAATATPAPTATPAQANQTVAPTDQSGESSSTSNTTLNTTSVAGTGQAPSANTSSSIASPTDLKIQQTSAENKPVLALNWIASKTTSIDGYKIFRSENETTGYKNIAKVNKEILEFKDIEIEVGKIYYYQVRSYKSSLESKSSNTVSKTVEAIVAPAEDPSPTIIADAMQPLWEQEEPSFPWWIIIVIIILLTAGALYKFKKWPFDKLKQNQIVK